MTIPTEDTTVSTNKWDDVDYLIETEEYYYYSTTKVAICVLKLKCKYVIVGSYIGGDKYIGSKTAKDKAIAQIHELERYKNMSDGGEEAL